MSEDGLNWSTDQLAEWATELTFDDLPADVIAKTEDCILDAIGCAIAGLDENGTRAVSDVAAGLYPGNQAGVWFRDLGLNAVGAAYANAAAISALDIDDGHRLAMGHPGAAVVPSALAIAEARGASGRDVITAIVAGYEIAVRLGHAEIKKPYHTGNWSGFGAAVAAAKLSGQDRDTMAQALAITAYHSPRLHDLTQSKVMGADVKESIPWSVVTGLVAADLAAHGFSGCRDALDLDGRFDPLVTLDDLGDGFRIMGTYFKNYSVCRWAHTSIWGLAQIMREQGLEADDVLHVHVDTFGQAAALNNNADPDNIISAQYSLPFTMAAAAVLGEETVSPLTADVIGNADVVALSERITINHDSDMDAHLPLRAPARISVETRQGRFEKTVITAWGDAGGDTGRDDYRGKFMRLAGRKLGEDRAREIATAVDGLQNGDVYGLTGKLTSLVSQFPRKAG